MKYLLTVIAIICTIGGFFAGYTIADTRARFRADLLTVNGAFVILQELRNDRTEKAASFIETQLVWNLAALTKYPKWAWWGGNADDRSRVVAEGIFVYIESDEIESLAQRVGSNEAELREFSQKLYVDR